MAEDSVSAEHPVGVEATTSERPVDVVRRFYDFMSEGKADEATALIDDDFVLHEPPGLPFGGEYHGVGGFVDSWKAIAEVADPEIVGQLTFLDTDPAVVLLRGRFTAASGQVAETDIVELFWVRNGKIVELDGYYKDPSAIAALA